MKRWVMWCCWAGALGAQEAAPSFAAAVADYRAGRHERAFATFQALAAQAGEAASPELRWNLALAALRVQRSADAEAAVAPWREAADATVRAEAAFVTALAACQRAERAALAAALPDAEPTAWTAAVAAMERAVAGFAQADAARGGWPEAQRNGARAAQRLTELRQQRDAAHAQPRQQEPTPPPPTPQPTPQPDEQPVLLPEQPLSAAELAAVRARIAARERQKQALRRDQQARGGVVPERGW